MSLLEVVQEFESKGKETVEFENLKSVYRSIVRQTLGYVVDAGFRHVVVGLSGGIDSSLVAKIAVDALGAENVHGIIMPGPFNSPDSMRDASDLAKWNNIDSSLLYIHRPVESFEEEIRSEIGSELSDLTLQNIQARSRMIYLMAVSNENNWMVLNTSNKSEVFTGYSTLYGDMVGAFAPIGDVYKTDVVKMCSAINMDAGIDVIPRNVIVKPPSAELKPNQTDEDSLGIDYVVLDKILHLMIDRGLDDKQIMDVGFHKKDVDLIRNKIMSSEFKRAYEPPCAKVPHFE